MQLGISGNHIYELTGDPVSHLFFLRALLAECQLEIGQVEVQTVIRNNL
jgi:hypothetical protein